MKKVCIVGEEAGDKKRPPQNCGDLTLNVNQKVGLDFGKLDYLLT